jgi:type IV pilus assembly protein PilM
MDKKENNKKDKINDVVKSKIKGLGLDALFHQVDITQKDPKQKKQSSVDHDDLKLMERIGKGTPLLQYNKMPRFINNFLANLNAKKTNNRVIIDIGTSNIKIMILKDEKEQTILQDAVFITIPHIVTTTQDKLDNFIKKSLLPIVNSPLFKTSSITSVISGSSMIVKFISLPSTQTQEIRKMLDFEIEQHLPFPKDEIEFDYQIISQEPPQSKVMIIAAKKAVIKEHLDLLASCGIYPDNLEVSSVALYNSSLLQTKKESIYLQVNIGASYTDINIIRNNCLCYCRSINWGSKDLTLRLSKNLNVSFDNAKKLKHENGIIITKKQANQIEKEISLISEKWADEIVFEIKRTIESFHLDSGKNDIQQLSLSGGGANLINLNEHLREKLKIKTVMEKPLELECSSNAIDTYLDHSREFHLICAAITPYPGHIKINLMPDHIKKNIQAKKLKAKQLTYSAVCALIIICLFILPGWLLKIRENQIKSLDKQINQLEPEVSDIKKLQDRINLINNYVDAKNSCMEVLRQMSLIVPYDITINNFAFEKSESVILTGFADSHSSVVNFSKVVSDSPIFEDCKIMYTRKKGPLSEEIVDFEIYCKINNRESP